MKLISEDNLGWRILTEEEKASLGLQIVQGKSSWEAGEILNKAHYKYLEIKQRAQKFLKMFTDHYQIYGKFFPDDLVIDEHFKQYLELTVIKRLTISKALEELNYDRYKVANVRDKLICKQIEGWRNSKISSEVNFYNIVMDFDRWNNFRILPRVIQEPSAFKRRNKNRFKKHIKATTAWFENSIEQIEAVYGYTRSTRLIKGFGYIGLISDKSKRVYKIIKVKLDNHDETINQLSPYYIYIFKAKDVAIEFTELVLDFANKGEKHCREGQIFWPKYRTMIEYALNYNEVQKITPLRNGLEKAAEDLDHRYLQKYKKKRYDDSFK